MASPRSHCRNGSKFETPVRISATMASPITSKSIRIACAQVHQNTLAEATAGRKLPKDEHLLSTSNPPCRITLSEATGGVRASKDGEFRLNASGRAVVDCGRMVEDAIDNTSKESLRLNNEDIRKLLEVLKFQLRQEFLTELQEDVDQHMSKLQMDFDQHFAQCIVQLQEVTVEQGRKIQDIEAISHQKILDLEAAVVSGLGEIHTMSKSFGEMANELEDGMKQALRPNTTVTNCGIDGDELKCLMQQLSEEKAERARSSMLREDVTSNFTHLRQEFQDAFAHVATLVAERDRQDSKISNLEARLNLKIAQMERSVAAGLADMNGFRQSPMALISVREKQRLVGEIEEKLKKATTGIETDITSLKEEVECLHKEAHGWHESKKLSVEQSDASSTQFPSDVSEDALEDYFVSEAPTKSHIPYLIWPLH